MSGPFNHHFLGKREKKPQPSSKFSIPEPQRQPRDMDFLVGPWSRETFRTVILNCLGAEQGDGEEFSLEQLPCCCLTNGGAGVCVCVCVTFRETHGLTSKEGRKSMHKSRKLGKGKNKAKQPAALASPNAVSKGEHVSF